jgi:hypothetical protein
VLTTCQPSTVWCSRERLPAAAAQPAKVRQSCSATDLFIFIRASLFCVSRYRKVSVLENSLAVSLATVVGGRCLPIVCNSNVTSARCLWSSRPPQLAGSSGVMLPALCGDVSQRAPLYKDIYLQG